MACFEKSSFVREVVLNLVRVTCRIRSPMGDAAQWHCVAEVETPRPGGGRLDLRLGCVTDRGNRFPVFHLESKLGSPLRIEQLRRYRRHGVKYVVAVTKHPPEVSKREIDAAGVFALRWQDFHRGLLKRRAPTSSDRFVVRSLVEYMEELDMASREDLTARDLENCRKLLNAISATRYREISPKDGFRNLDSCLALLRELRIEFIEDNPKFAGHHSWGPGYFSWFEERSRIWHALGWDLWKRRWTRSASASACGFLLIRSPKYLSPCTRRDRRWATAKNTRTRSSRVLFRQAQWIADRFASGLAVVLGVGSSESRDASTSTPAYPNLRIVEFFTN